MCLQIAYWDVDHLLLTLGPVELVTVQPNRNSIADSGSQMFWVLYNLQERRVVSMLDSRTDGLAVLLEVCFVFEDGKVLLSCPFDCCSPCKLIISKFSFGRFFGFFCTHTKPEIMRWRGQVVYLIVTR